MDKKIAGLLGAAAALTVVTAANAAAPSDGAGAPPATYRELLNPVTNAVAALKADDARQTEQASDQGTELAQFFYHHHHHHHHHRYHHHHHHHHHY